MRGVTYEYLDGKSYMCFGDSRIPTGEAPMPRGMLACARLFMLDPTKAGEPTPTDTGELIYTLSYEGVQANVTEREGAPVKIEGRVNGFTCTYTNIEITYG